MTTIERLRAAGGVVGLVKVARRGSNKKEPPGREGGGADMI